MFSHNYTFLKFRNRSHLQPLTSSSCICKTPCTSYHLQPLTSFACICHLQNALHVLPFATAHFFFLHLQNALHVLPLHLQNASHVLPFATARFFFLHLQNALYMAKREQRQRKRNCSQKDFKWRCKGRISSGGAKELKSKGFQEACHESAHAKRRK